MTQADDSKETLQDPTGDASSNNMRSRRAASGMRTTDTATAMSNRRDSWLYSQAAQLKMKPPLGAASNLSQSRSNNITCFDRDGGLMHNMDEATSPDDRTMSVMKVRDVVVDGRGATPDTPPRHLNTTLKKGDALDLEGDASTASPLYKPQAVIPIVK